MKKLYSLLFILSCFELLQAQTAIEAVTTPDSRYRFANKSTGQWASEHTWQEAGTFVNGFAKVADNHKWGFVDNRGIPVIKPAYESARDFVNKLAAVRKNSKWGFINERGAVIIPFEYDIVFDFKENITAVYRKNKWQLIDKKGNITSTPDIDVFYGFKKGLARVSKNGRAGTMNTRGEIISMESPVKQTQANNATRPSLAQAAMPCPDNIGFDRGNFSNWSCYTGDVGSVGTTNVITVNPSPPTANRHVIYPAANPSNIDPYGLFPVNPPDGSGFALKLGNNVNGAEAERVSYQLTVPANAVDASITYRYAVVFQDPGHLRHQQPRFSAKLLDVATNTYIRCASYEYVSDDTIPGFFTSPVDDSVKCKAWSSVFINLSAYAGRTLILEFTSADCTLGAHWGYTYVDVGDCNITADIQYECNPNRAILTGPPGFLRYWWWNEDYSTRIGGARTTVLNPPPTNNSTIHLEVIPYNGATCSDTLHVAFVNPLPTADAGPDKTICSGKAAGIGATAVPGNTYQWSPSDHLSNPNTASPTASPPVTTTYIVTMTNTANGCFDQDTVTVFVNPTPVAAFEPDPDQCLADNRFNFTNTSTGASNYRWSFGDGDSSVATNPAHSYLQAQTFPVKLVVTANSGCNDSVTRAVTVHPQPVVNTGNDRSICRGSSTRLQATGAQTYEWTPATDLSCADCDSPIASPVQNTVYVVSGTSAFGCTDRDTVAVTVHQPISVNASPDATICAGESVQLSASGASTYVWTPSRGLSDIRAANPVATPPITTRYRVVGFDANGCFTDTAFVEITVNPVPTIELGADLYLPTGSMHTFNPVTSKGPFRTWEWTPTTDLSCNDCPNPTATIKNDIRYHVMIENIYGCRAIDSVNIKTFCENAQVFVPNAFSPDGDGVNDILMVRAKGINYVNSFRVFTRWGELVFEKKNFTPNSPAHGWDGRIRGVTAPAEVYVYTAEVTCDNLQTYTYKGNVSILK